MKKQYISYNEAISFLEQTVSQHPNLFRLQSIGTTWEGRPIMMITIANDVAYADLKPATLYTGTIHAREWVGIELAINYVKYIVENYQSNLKLIRTLSLNTFYMVPCLNPDGYEYSRTHFSFWRKNRRDNGDGTFGVDLNRNFGTKFKRAKNTHASTYGGPEAFSEPETRAIRDFVSTHKNITIALDYHSQGNVFFPAHRFKHETEVEGTDLNILCANMNDEITKVTGRKYGIHRGKPPANLIHGSGREYYYDQGILATVVEVGTRNISDYLDNMSQSIAENIPALTYALSESINYSKLAPPRIQNFGLSDISLEGISLCWDPIDDHDISYEIYRSTHHKNPCKEQNLIFTTKRNKFTDHQFENGKAYYYNIRAVNRSSKIKSPFAHEISIEAPLAADEFARRLYPQKKHVGFVGENNDSKNNLNHFGYNSMFVGVNQRRGISYGVIKFNTENLPQNIVLRSAHFSLYPMNRVNCKIEKFGEWSISLIEVSDDTILHEYEQIHNAKVIHTFGQTIPSDQLTQGIWSEWKFNGVEQEILTEAIKKGNVIFRINGPKTLPFGSDSQTMQFDLGYGPFGGGIHYRPCLNVRFTEEHIESKQAAASLNTLFKDEILINQLSVGFDKEGSTVEGHMEFDLSDFDPLTTAISEAYIELNNQNFITTNKDIRITIGISEFDSENLNDLRNQPRLELVGLEVSNSQLKNKSRHQFIFDSYGRSALEALIAENKPLSLVIKVTAESSESNALIHFSHSKKEINPALVIRYVNRRQKPLEAPKNLTVTVDNNITKLCWENPDHKDFVGAYVVRNAFRPPKTPYDGVKLYAGKDNYTFDRFGDPNREKYYSIFSYDNVPNYSTPIAMYYTAQESYVLDDTEFDYDKPLSQDDDQNI